jgi:hypothetical protein
MPSLTCAFDCFRYAWVFQNRFVFHIRIFDCFNFNVEIQFVASNYREIGLIVTSCAICDFLRREGKLMTELMNHKRSTS